MPLATRHRGGNSSERDLGAVKFKD